MVSKDSIVVLDLLLARLQNVLQSTLLYFKLLLVALDFLQERLVAILVEPQRRLKLLLLLFPATLSYVQVALIPFCVHE